ncbi:MAG: hypothetical protein U0350_44440 [Caldilineaceae bacterium]
MCYYFRSRVVMFVLAGMLLFAFGMPVDASPMTTTKAGVSTQEMANLSSSKPTIKFVSVPAYGSFDNLTGQVRRANPANYRVVVYIYVRSGWWIKPYLNQPQTIISPDGHWTCDITTGGIDQFATKIIAYLIPATYTPPGLLGASTLPAELEKNAVAKVKVTRHA